MHSQTRRRNAGRIIGLIAALATSAGCANPLTETSQQQLHDSLIAAHRRELTALAGSKPITLTRSPSAVEQSLSPRRKAQLDKISGGRAYWKNPINPGKNPLGQPGNKIVKISLEKAVHLAVKYNLDLQGDRLSPAIAQTQVTQAAAAFDANFFTNLDYQNLDTPRPHGIFSQFVGNQQSENLALSTGITKHLSTGGQVTVQTDLKRNEQTPTIFDVNHYYNADVLMSLTQPLLRNLGSDVNRADIELAKNARRSEVEKLRGNLINTVAQVEQAYWALTLTVNRVHVQQQLLDRTRKDRDRLIKRQNFDVTPVQIAQANSYLETNRVDFIRAQFLLRTASDRLKALMHSPDLPISGETLVMPTEQPLDKPITVSLLDAVTTALRHRPDLQTALLQIKDASIRQRVADNGLLPILNISATVRYNGLNTTTGATAYGNVFQGNFIDYLLSGQFQMPIGNRGPEARYKQRRLEREQSVLAYQSQAQNAIEEVKNAIRTLASAYELIGATRAARRSAADNLRALDEQETAGAALTPEFLLNLKLNAEQQLATNEITEAQALVGYNNAITTFYQSMGTLLAHDGIDFQASAQYNDN